MSFVPHNNNVTCKATKVLNFIKHNLYKCSRNIKSNGYLSFVQPSLKYASSIWDPYYKTHNLTIERVQRRALIGHLIIMFITVVCLSCCKILTGLLYNIANKELDYHCFTNLYII